MIIELSNFEKCTGLFYDVDHKPYVSLYLGHRLQWGWSDAGQKGKSSGQA